MSTATTRLFDPISGDLLPAYREDYVQSRLSPDLHQAVETYLKSSPIQANIVLGRAQVLLAAAQAEGDDFAPPLWVQAQLRQQPTASAAGPLRRPVVRLVLGLFLLLITASVVQWLRNEPLVPAPVAKAVAQVATSATQATRHLVQRLTSPSEPLPPVNASPVALSKPVEQPTRAQVARVAPPVAIEARVPQLAAVSSQPADSLAAPATLAATAPSAGVTVRGRITDSQGRALPGATVLVQGTRQAVSTNSIGDYELSAPVGSILQFGYGGYTDQFQRYSGATTLNVVLLQSSMVGGHSRK